MKKTLKVEGMVCEGCENRIKNALLEVEGVQEVSANYRTKEVMITCNKEIEDLEKIITSIGFSILKDEEV